jgi:NAD(P)-dependent dehydrogenase (short-subunit alcohol dehydrogenase family)
MSGFSLSKGKVAVVTGGASGIGKGIAKQMVKEGAKVVIADIEDKALQETAKEIGAVGIRCDVSDYNSVQALADATKKKFGTVHVIVNNAGVNPKCHVSKTTMDDWKWVLGVDLWGVIYGIKIFMPILQANPDGGHIVNVSSIGGLVPGGENYGMYTTAKFGVVGLSEVLAQELAMESPKVGITIFCPILVTSNLSTSTRNRPAWVKETGGKDIKVVDAASFGGDGLPWMSIDDVGVVVTSAMKRGDLYCTTHPYYPGMLEGRTKSIVESMDHGKEYFFQ